MKIATYVDQAGAVANVYEQGEVRVYDQVDGTWTCVQTLPFRVDYEMTLTQVKAAVRDVATALGDCKVFLSSEVRGLIYSILQEEMGFHTWKSDGSLDHQLDTVAEKEVVYAAEKAREAAQAAAAPKVRASGCCGGGGGGWIRLKAPPPAAEALGDGHYRFDLVRVLKDDPNLNSRLALIPVMEETPFSRLEILCDHIPRWFTRKLLDLNLRAEFEHRADQVRVMVFPKHDGQGA